jgi:hypothetical protein
MRCQRFVLSLLLLALVCLAWGDESPAKPRRGTKATAEEATKEEKPAEKRHPYQGPPCSCVQDLLQDRYPPGPSVKDVWYCIDYRDTTNPCSDPEDDCWVGIPDPSVPPPQICENNNCEPLIERDAKKCPGHEEDLTQDKAFGIVAQRLENARLNGHSRINLAGCPEYHTIQDEFKKYFVMIVPLDVPDPKTRNSTRRLYFGVELDSAAVLTSVNDVSVHHPKGGGRISVTYKVKGDKRTALVWLKH